MTSDIRTAFVCFHDGPPARLLSASCASAFSKAQVIILPEASTRDKSGILEALRDRGKTLLIKDPSSLILPKTFDGFYITDPSAFHDHDLKAAAKQGTLGLGGIVDRHTALERGEREPDFILFGAPEKTTPPPALGKRREFMAWWQETIVIPLVVFASSEDEERELSAAGAEWIAFNTGDRDDPA